MNWVSLESILFLRERYSPWLMWLVVRMLIPTFGSTRFISAIASTSMRYARRKAVITALKRPTLHSFTKVSSRIRTSELAELVSTVPMISGTLSTRGSYLTLSILYGMGSLH